MIATINDEIRGKQAKQVENRKICVKSVMFGPSQSAKVGLKLDSSSQLRPSHPMCFYVVIVPVEPGTDQ